MAIRKGRGKRTHSTFPAWKIIFMALILASLFLVGKLAAESCTRTGRDANRVAAPGHYPDLELASEQNPGARPNSLLKSYEGFTLMFNPDNHTPDWVGWELLGSESDGESARSNRFWHDEDMEGCAFTEDYRNSDFDRGHLCPAADQKWSPEAMRDCFVMTNIAPQDHKLNSGAWATLEKKERLWAKRDSAIVIVAGPVYRDSDNRRLGETGVRVPSAFFKVILAPYADSPRAIGFLYPNMHSPGNMENYACTVDEIEKLTGLDFFSSLPDSIENYVESHKMFREWNQ